MAVTIRTMGGLGNQSFMYALSLALKAFGNEVFLERSWFTNGNRAWALDRFNTDCQFGPIRGQCVQEGNLRFHPEILKKYEQDTTLVGYWQNEKYFAGVEDQVRKDLTLRNYPSNESLSIANQIANSSSVFLHVRRTDSLSGSGLKNHGVCPQSYYQRAASYVSTRVKDPHFFIFSDDIAWCKQNIQVFGYPATFVDHNTTGVTESPEHEVRKTDSGTEEQDLFLMSRCKHGITANSSFSWMGAWLNPNPNKIIVAPRQWFATGSPHDGSEIVPENWVRL